MEEGALERIRKTLTPEVIIEFAQDTEEGIVAQVRHLYYYPEREIQKNPITWAKTIEVEADREGNVFSAKGLFS